MVQPSSSRGEIDVFGSIPREGSAAMKNVAFNLQGSDGKSMTENRAIFGRASGVDNISRGASVSVHPKSSETAFKILKQLDRTIPSPTSKPLGLRQTLANRNTSSVATNRQIKGPDFSIGNGNKQSSINESGSANSETTYGKKVYSHLHFLARYTVLLFTNCTCYKGNERFLVILPIGTPNLV
jgi:hypothetical protein